MARKVSTVLTLKDEMTKKFKAIGNASDSTAKGIQRKFTLMGKKISGVGKKVTNVGRGLTAGVTLPIIGAATVATKKYAEVDKTMALVNSTMKNSESEAGRLSQAMKDAAANSTYGMDEAAQAALNFARGGWNAEQAANALAPAMNLAAGEGGDLETVSAGLMATMNSFGADASEASEYADVFANACNNSALDVNGLADSMSVAAPIFKTSGSDVQDAALAMGVMANAGTDANVAANALKTGIARLASPAKEGAEWMEKLRIKAFDSEGNLKHMEDLQYELSEAFHDLSSQEKEAAASAIFGKNQMAPWLSLIGTAPEDVGKLNKALDEQGTAGKMAEDMMSGFGGSLEKIKSSVDVLATSFGESLAPYISIAAEKIQQITDKFNALSPKQRDTVVKIGLLIAAVGPALMIIGKIIGIAGLIVGHLTTIISVIMKIVNAVRMVITVAKVVFAFIAANPIVLVIAGIIAVIAVVIRFRQQIWAALQAVAEKIRSFVADARAKLGEFVAAVGEKIQAAKAKFEEIKSKVSEVFRSVANTIISTLSRPFNWLSEKVNGIKSLLSGVGESIKNAISKAKTKGNATGTRYYTGGTTWVGENGPELVDLPSGSKVYPHTKSANMGGGTSPVVNVTIQGNVIGNEDFAALIGNKVADTLMAAMA